jgi:hypothetical protein
VEKTFLQALPRARFTLFRGLFQLCFDLVIRRSSTLNWIVITSLFLTGCVIPALQARNLFHRPPTLFEISFSLSVGSLNTPHVIQLDCHLGKQQSSSLSEQRSSPRIRFWWSRRFVSHFFISCFSVDLANFISPPKAWCADTLLSLATEHV